MQPSAARDNAYFARVITVPNRLFTLPTVSVHYQDADCVVLRKRLSESQHERPSYTKLHVLSMVRSGHQHITTDEDKTYRVEAGQAILLRRGLYTVTDLLPATGQPFCADLIYFTGRGIAPEDSTADCSGKPFHLSLDRLPTSPEAIYDLVAQLPGIQTVLRAPHRRDSLTFLELHYDKPFTLEDLAFLTGQSVSTFQRNFRARTGQSPRAWIVRRRMQAARDLLRHHQVSSIAEAATAVGYRNTSHFIAAYRKTYGHTPLTEYRHFAPAAARPLS